jgi:hypothetical protein
MNFGRRLTYVLCHMLRMFLFRLINSNNGNLVFRCNYFCMARCLEKTKIQFCLTCSPNRLYTNTGAQTGAETKQQAGMSERT